MEALVSWTGISGNPYQFEVYAWGQEFNPVSGVYILCRLVGPGRYEALYVGEAKSLHDRLNTGLHDHDGAKRAIRERATHIAVLRTYDDTYRLGVETDLRHGLDPICNRQGVSETEAIRQIARILSGA